MREGLKKTGIDKEREDLATKIPVYPVTTIYISNRGQAQFFIGCWIEPEKGSRVAVASAERIRLRAASISTHE